MEGCVGDLVLSSGVVWYCVVTGLSWSVRCGQRLG